MSSTRRRAVAALVLWASVTSLASAAPRNLAIVYALCWDDGAGTWSLSSCFVERTVAVWCSTECSADTQAAVAQDCAALNSIIGRDLLVLTRDRASAQVSVYVGGAGAATAARSGWSFPTARMSGYHVQRLRADYSISQACVWVAAQAADSDTRGVLMQELSQALGPSGDAVPSIGAPVRCWVDGRCAETLAAEERYALWLLYTVVGPGQTPAQVDAAAER